MFNIIPALTKEPTKEDPLYLYLIINKDLNMSIGKTGGQIGHAIQYFMEYLIDWSGIQSTEKGINFCSRYYNWKINSKASKITLGVNTKEFNKIKEEYNPILVIDAGHTEIEAGSETVLCLYPMFKNERSKTLKRLQLLK